MAEVIEKTENKKGYKKTKLGWIPEEWVFCSILDLVNWQILEQPMDGNHGELHPTANDYVDNGIPFVMANNIVNNRLNLDDCHYITKEFANNLHKGFSITNDILFTHKGSIGNVAFVKNIKTDFIILTPQVTYYRVINDKKLSRYYLFIFLQYKKFLDYIQKLCKGGTRDYIGILKQLDLPFILPPIQEQEKIAEILSAWDDGIATLEKLIEQKEVFHKALMKNLLVGKKRLAEFNKNSEYKRTRLGQIPADWQIKPLKLLFDKRMQKYSGNTEHNIFTNSATKGVVLQNEYFDRSIVTEENTSNYYVVGENDFMYNPRISQSAPAGPINRNKLGITGIASPLYTIFKAKHNTIIDFYEQYFSSNLWNNSMFMVANQGARHDRLNITSNDFMNMPLPYPPIEEQEKIAQILIESYKEIQILNSKLEKLKEQKKGLMQKLLTGQIRVKL